jgi:hypothetical protein
LYLSDVWLDTKRCPVQSASLLLWLWQAWVYRAKKPKLPLKNIGAYDRTLSVEKKA